MTSFHLTSTRKAASLAALMPLLLAACSGSGAATPGESVAASVQPSVAATPTQAAATPTLEPTGAPTALDPCQLVPAGEASSLSGASFSSGTPSASGSAKLCTYGTTATNTVTVAVGQAADEATAKLDEQQFVASLQEAAANGLTLTQLPGFASGADAATLEGSFSDSGQTVAISAIYVLKGTTFFGISDLVINGAAPTTDALKAEAMTVLGRI